MSTTAASPPSFDSARAEFLAIQSACGANDVSTLKSHHSPDAHLEDYKDGNGAGPFHWAAAAGSVSVLKYLLEISTSPSLAVVQADSKKRTPLMAACAQPKGAPAVEYLLTLDAVNSKINQDADGITALHLAVCHPTSAVSTKLLLSAGADPNAPSSAGPPLLWALGHNGSLESCMALLDSGADIDAKDENGATALILACLMGNEPLARRLVDMGADVQVYARNLSPLAAAAVSNSTAIAQLLLDKNRDLVHMRDPVEKLRAVEVAAHAVNREVCAFLCTRTDPSLNCDELMKRVALESAEEEAKDAAREELANKASLVAREEGNALFRKGDTSGAAKVFTKGLSGSGASASKDNRAVLLTNLSLCLFKMGQFEPSRQSASQALELTPNYVKALVRQGAACAALKDHEASARAYWQAYSLDKGGKDATQLLNWFNEQIRLAREAQGVGKE